MSEWPPQFLEYVLVQPLTHLHERLHHARFWHLVGRARVAGPYRARRPEYPAAGTRELLPGAAWGP